MNVDQTASRALQALAPEDSCCSNSGGGQTPSVLCWGRESEQSLLGCRSETEKGQRNSLPASPPPAAPGFRDAGRTREAL